MGKSSLINSLLGAGMAKVSASPGRTRSINFYAISVSAKHPPCMLFADLPGYGYAKISKSISAGWRDFIDPYLQLRPHLTRCICLIDSNIPAQPLDRQLLSSLRAMDRESLVVGTKADRLSGNQRAQASARLKADLGLAELLLCSSKTKLGIQDLWSRIVTAAQPAAGSLGV